MRKLFTLVALLALILTVAPATDVLAAGSPVAETITDASEITDDKEETTEPGSNTGDKSPQTGAGLPLACIAIISAAGTALVAAKKITE